MDRNKKNKTKIQISEGKRIMNDWDWSMAIALEQAEVAYKLGEVPVGAVLLSQDGKIIAKTYNKKETEFNPCGHAEILAIQEAAKNLKNWRLVGATLVVTLEPCLMCMTAMIQARIKQLVFGAYDPKGGALSLGYHFQHDSRLNHHFSIIGGWRHYETSKILSQFFKERRESYRP
jgi:tRNA(adenine34) deaminase